MLEWYSSIGWQIQFADGKKFLKALQGTQALIFYQLLQLNVRCLFNMTGTAIFVMCCFKLKFYKQMQKFMLKTFYPNEVL
jgi:hypothetical protein